MFKRCQHRHCLRIFAKHWRVRTHHQMLRASLCEHCPSSPTHVCRNSVYRTIRPSLGCHHIDPATTLHSLWWVAVTRHCYSWAVDISSSLPILVRPTSTHLATLLLLWRPHVVFSVGKQTVPFGRRVLVTAVCVPTTFNRQVSVLFLLLHDVIPVLFQRRECHFLGLEHKRGHAPIVYVIIILRLKFDFCDLLVLHHHADHFPVKFEVIALRAYWFE